MISTPYCTASFESFGAELPCSQKPCAARKAGSPMLRHSPAALPGRPSERKWFPLRSAVDVNICQVGPLRSSRVGRGDLERGRVIAASLGSQNGVRSCRNSLQRLRLRSDLALALSLISLIAPAQRRTPRQRAIILSIGCLPGGQHLS